MLDASRTDLHTTQSTIAGQNHKLEGTQHTIAVRKNEQKQAAAKLAALRSVLAKARNDLANANLESQQKAEELAALAACAKATTDATGAHNAGNAASAIAILRNAEGQCDALQRGATANPVVYPFDFADPTVLAVGGTYYAYSTNSALGNVQVLSSSDLTHWTIVGDALPTLPVWAITGGAWAPSVARLGQYYVLYYTVREGASWGPCISVAISTAPTGPFLDPSTAPMICQHENHGSIDPRVFVDSNGTPLLMWTSERGLLPGAIWSQQLTPDGVHTTGPVNMLVHADRDWEAGTTEAPAMVQTGGTFALFYSGNNWSTDKYAVGEARCASPAGPCTKVDAPVFGTHDDIAGPGSGDVFTTPNGELMMIYGAYQQPNVGYPASRLLHVARVNLTPTGVSFSPR